jgi:lipopolysaccharide biosynthesis glycosyltransferase
MDLMMSVCLFCDNFTPVIFCRFGKDTKVVHFIGGQKPWHLTYNVSTGQVQGQAQSQSHGQEMLQSWWSLFLDKVQPSLQPGVVRTLHN